MSMIHEITVVKVLDGYRVCICSADGTQGEVDLSDLVGKGVFVAWSDPEEFKKLFIDPESHTLAWPGGIDLAPDALYQDVTAERAA